MTIIIDETIKWVGFAASVLAFITVLFNIYIDIRNNRARKKEELRRKEPIQIKLTSSKIIITLPGVIPREHMQRNEVMGRIGAVPKKQSVDGQEQKRFFLLYPNKSEFLNRIDELYYGAGEDRTLSVECSNEEIEQFDMEKIKDREMGFELVASDLDS